MSDQNFWHKLAHLISTHEIIIDRPKGSAHPQYPDYIYPYDYGYLENTSAADGDGIDVWVGTLPDKKIVAVIFTVDTSQKDAEIKLLLGCTREECDTILATHNRGSQAGILVMKEQ